MSPHLRPHVACFVIVIAAHVAAAAAAAQELALIKEPVPVPAELAEPIRALLQPQGSVVTRGANRVELWWIKGIALDTAPAVQPSWSNVPDGAMVGAMRLAEPMPDIRGVTIKAGVYTLRFALQPQNGDHMGVSPFREFLLVSPAAEDLAADPLGYKGAVALAKKTVGKSHPAALALDPPSTGQPPGSVVTNEAGHKGIVFTVPVTLQGGNAPAGALTFGLTLVGQYEH